MYTVDRFEFTTTPPPSANVVIDKTPQGKAELLERVALALSFPDYFGRNWDALIDCLSDLSWCHEPEAIIDHADIPNLQARDLRLYLESLIDASDRRGPERLPRLRIMFRVKDRETVAQALATELTD